jgi:hypothetical protein
MLEKFALVDITIVKVDKTMGSVSAILLVHLATKNMTSSCCVIILINFHHIKNIENNYA